MVIFIKIQVDIYINSSIIHYIIISKKYIYFDIMSWLSNPNANRFKNIYLQGFLNISGGDVNLRNGNLIVDGTTILNKSLNSYSYDNANFNSNFGKNWININLNNTTSVQQSITISATGQYQVFTQNNNSDGNVILSNKYGNTWRDTGLKSFDLGNFQHVAISKNGKYILILIRPPTIYINSGSFYLSSDYGTTWIKPSISIYGYPQSVSISYDGKYQTIVTSNKYNTDYGYIYISNDYGNTWSQKISLISGFQSVSISATGKYQTAVPFTLDKIRYSINYGKDWTPNTQTVDNTNATTIQVPFLNNSLLSQTVSISYDGKYQTTFGINNGNILINNNYGEGIWSDSNINPGGFFSGISLSSTGQYQIVGSYNLSTGASIYISTNYGQTWNQNSLFVNYQPYNTSYYINSVSVSSNGDYITTLINYFDMNNNFISGNIYLSSIPSSITPLININTFGTPTSGNVFTHPLGITVPNSLNSGLYLGYDIGNNHGYINSLNQTGSTNMCLQSQGGFIGIGNSYPKFTLDISGEVNISGNLYPNTISLGNSSIKYSTISGYSNASSGLLINSDNIMVNPTKNGNIFLQPNGGKIGIGKYSADYTLDICGTVNITNPAGSGLILNSTNIQTYGSGYGINLDGVSNRTLPSSQILAIDVLSNTTDLVFKTATYSSSGESTQNIERMRISNTGTIGIGITNPSSNFIADISGALRVNLDTGVNGSTTTGTIVLCHSNNVNNITNGSSTILYKNTLYDSNYSSITYYDSVSNISTFPSYGYLNSSVLTIDSNGNSTTNNIVLRANGYIIVDTYFNTYFINGVSIGTSICTPNYLLDVSGDINTININSIGITTNTLLTTGNIDISNANINAISNCFINGFLIRSPKITANLITVTELDVTNINITDSVKVQSIFVSDFINITSTIDSSNINSGSFVTNGGIGCAKSLYIGDTLYTDNIICDSGTISIQNGGTINMDYQSTLSAIDSTIQVGNMFVRNNLNMDSGSAFVSKSLTISESGIITNPSPIGDIDCTSSVLNAGLVNISDTCTFSPESIVVLQNTASSSNIMTGALTISGGVGIGKNVNIGGSVNIRLHTNIGDSLYVYNSIIGNAITANNGLTVNKNFLVVNFGMRMNGSLNQLYCEGIINCTNSTSSTSTTSGALTVIGGVGIGGDINIGGKSTVSKLLTANGGLSIASGNIIDFGAQVATNCMISLYANPTPTSSTLSFYGFGIAGYILRYQVPNTGNHVFYTNTDSNNNTPLEIARFNSSGLTTNNLPINTGTGNMNCGGNITSAGLLTNGSFSNNLGSSIGSTLFLQNSIYTANNAIQLQTYAYRFATAGDWTTQSTRIQSKIDSTLMGMLEFNNPSQTIALRASNGSGITINANGTTTTDLLLTANNNIQVRGSTNPRIDLFDSNSTPNRYFLSAYQGGTSFDIGVDQGTTTGRSVRIMPDNTAVLVVSKSAITATSVINATAGINSTYNLNIMGYGNTEILQWSDGNLYFTNNVSNAATGANNNSGFNFRNLYNTGSGNSYQNFLLINSKTDGKKYYNCNLLPIWANAGIVCTDTFNIFPPAIPSGSNPYIVSIVPNLSSNTKLFINTVASSGAYNSLAQAGDIMIQYSAATSDSGALIICPWSISNTAIRMTSGTSATIALNAPGGININNNTFINGTLTTNNNNINAGTGTIQGGSIKSQVATGGYAGFNSYFFTNGDSLGTTYFDNVQNGSSINFRIGASLPIYATINTSGLSVNGTITTNNNINAGSGTINCKTLNITNIQLNGSYGSVGQVLTSNGTGTSYWSNNSATGFAPKENPTFTGTLTAPLLVANSQSFLFPNSGLNSSYGGFGYLTGNYLIGNGECDFVSTYLPDNNNRCAFAFLKQKSSSNASSLMQIDNYGNINASTYNATSDYRIKENIKQITATIDDLKPVQYYNTQTKNEDMGFIAHEIQEQFPFLVTGEKDAKDMQSLNYMGIIALLTKELQELKITVRSLQTKIEILETK